MFSLHFASSIESYSTLCQSSEHCFNLNSTLEEIQSTNSTPNPCLWPRYIDTVSMITVKCYLEKPAASAKTIHFHFNIFVPRLYVATHRFRSCTIQLHAALHGGKMARGHP